MSNIIHTKIPELEFNLIQKIFSDNFNIIAYEKVVLLKKEYYILSNDFWNFVRKCGYTVPIVLIKNTIGMYIAATKSAISYIFKSTNIINNNCVKLNLDKKNLKFYLTN